VNDIKCNNNNNHNTRIEYY